MIIKYIDYFYKQGIKCIPLVHKKKIPLYGESWKTTTYSKEQIEQKVFNDGCNLGIVCGSQSDNLVCLDFDDIKIYEELKSKYPWLEKISNTTTVVQTSRGIHLYLKSPIPVKSSKDSDFKIDIKAENSYIVAPPSIHPTGIEYQFLNGFKPIYQLKKLSEIPFLQLKPYEDNFTIPFYPCHTDLLIDISGMKKKKIEKILSGDKLHHPSRSEAEAALITLCIKNGWSEEKTFQLFERYSAEESKYRGKGKYRQDYFSYVFSSALQYYHDKKRDFDKMIDGWINGFKFCSFLSSNEKLCLLAVFRICKEVGRIDNLNISSYQLADYMGRSQNHSFTSLKRLCTLGFLLKIGKTQTNIFSLDDKSIESKFHNDIIPYYNNCYGIILLSKNISIIQNLNNDCFRQEALNSNGIFLIEFLNENIDNFYTLQEISEKTGIKYSTLRKKIIMLEGMKILKKIKKEKKNRYRIDKEITFDDLYKIAKKYKTAGMLKKQIEHHKELRETQKIKKVEFSIENLFEKKGA